ncbi:hypothetical protein N8927_02850 [Crocinitomicaceae bacterium]|nr:hypothetical protein [Crocinitomicaceae bacterium]
MKKLFIVLSVVALGFTSCGEASGEASGDEKKAEGSSQKAIPSSVCDCIELEIDMMKDVIMTGMSEEDVFTKYANEMEPCLAIVDNKSSDDFYKEAEDCASIQEFKKIEKELKEKMMSEEMMDQGLEAIEDRVSPE